MLVILLGNFCMVFGVLYEPSLIERGRTTIIILNALILIFNIRYGGINIIKAYKSLFKLFELKEDHSDFLRLLTVTASLILVFTFIPSNVGDLGYIKLGGVVGVLLLFTIKSFFVR